MEFYLNKARSFEPVNLLSKFDLLQSESLFYFLVNSLKSSWTAVRANSFELLSKYAEDYPLLNNATFLNGLLLPTALDFLNDPRAMMAEASALMLKLALTKCIKVVDLKALCGASDCEDLEFDNNAIFKADDDKRLVMCWIVLSMVKARLKNFQSSLISQGKTSTLIHGLLAFFKHLFSDFKLGT